MMVKGLKTKLDRDELKRPWVLEDKSHKKQINTFKYLNNY